MICLFTFDLQQGLERFYPVRLVNASIALEARATAMAMAMVLKKAPPPQIGAD